MVGYYQCIKEKNNFGAIYQKVNAGDKKNLALISGKVNEGDKIKKMGQFKKKLRAM